jgi:hypothetical protein
MGKCFYTLIMGPVLGNGGPTGCYSVTPLEWVRAVSLIGRVARSVSHLVGPSDGPEIHHPR